LAKEPKVETKVWTLGPRRWPMAYSVTPETMARMTMMAPCSFGQMRTRSSRGKRAVPVLMSKTLCTP